MLVLLVYSSHSMRGIYIVGGLQSEESKRLSSMLNRYPDAGGGLQVDITVVVALCGEDECRQPSIRISTMKS